MVGRNEVHGDGWGTIVQAGYIDRLHIHPPRVSGGEAPRGGEDR